MFFCEYSLGHISKLYHPTDHQTYSENTKCIISNCTKFISAIHYRHS